MKTMDERRADAVAELARQVRVLVPRPKWWCPWRKATQDALEDALRQLALYAHGGVGLMLIAEWVSSLRDWNDLNERMKSEQVPNEALDNARERTAECRRLMEALVDQAAGE